MHPCMDANAPCVGRIFREKVKKEKMASACAGWVVIDVACFVAGCWASFGPKPLEFNEHAMLQGCLAIAVHIAFALSTSSLNLAARWIAEERCKGIAEWSPC